VEQKEAQEVAVAVTKKFLLSLVLVGFLSPSFAAVLPEERADALYHSYDGGGITVDGPSILVRKNFNNSFSLTANYYVDMITSASIDVEARASEYTEERTEYSIGVDYLRNKTMMSLGYTNSEENDFSAKSYNFGISQDFFGDLTTVAIGYAFGDDEIRKTGNDTFLETAQRQTFKLSVSQIITKNLILNFTTDTITDEGYLNNPYRAVRYFDPANIERQYEYQDELYPNTRTSTAFAFRGKYYLPYRAALKLEYRQFNDTWKIDANNYEIEYIHPFGENWVAEIKFRGYQQTAAEFYQDLFEYRDATNFRARDKEMSSYSNTSVGAGVTYMWNFAETDAIKRISLNLFWDRMHFDYDNFRDVRVQADTPGEEPLYQLDADVIRFFVSLWF